eukprot:TRINITY_DN5597_c0_g2_i9.p1 TRINITY_DN5597_c0_g2~~TRINITY_DN5597_c0_g2_i9.p1  ORF type:complete len:460 (+),score=104.95 TRINITY_DN5597_c0_g2_i9:73-1452(+)
MCIRDREYHKELETKGDIGQLKTKLFDILRRLLRQIAFTKDEAEQLQYLNKVYLWFYKKRRMAKKSKVKSLNASFDVVANHGVPPPGNPFKDNNRQERTQHEGFSPSKKLQKYDIKSIRLSIDTTTLSTPKKPPSNISPVSVRSHFIYYKPRSIREQRIEQFWFSKKNALVGRKRNSQEFRQAVNAWGLAKSRFNENLLRKYENKNFGSRFFVRDSGINLGDKKKLVKNGVKEARVSQSVDYEELYREVSIASDDEMPHYNSGRELFSIREHTKLPEIIDLSKSIIEEANTKKHSSRVARHKKTTKSVPKAETAISEADKSHVDYIRKVYGPLINQAKLDVSVKESIFETGPKSVMSLSLYNRVARRPNSICEVPTRGTPVTHSVDKARARISQMKEILNIKEHLARQSVECDMAALEKAILLPEDHPESPISPNSLVQPGSRLMVNPFEVPKNAKKRK